MLHTFPSTIYLKLPCEISCRENDLKASLHLYLLDGLYSFLLKNAVLKGNRKIIANYFGVMILIINFDVFIHIDLAL